MKRTTLISATLLLAFAGCSSCGQGWRPNFFTRIRNSFHGVSNVGEPCDAGCHHAATEHPVAAGGCETCGTNAAMGYGGYETVLDSYESAPAATTTYGTPYAAPTYPSANPAPARRLEPIQGKPAS